MANQKHDVTALEEKPLGNTTRKKVISWAMWDWGTQPFNTIIITFVFGVYITSDAFGSENTTSGALALSTTVSGLLIALMAPVLGQSSDRSGHKVRNMRWMTWGIAAISASLFFIKPDPNYLWPGLILLGVGSILSEIGSVHYNAVLDDIASPRNVGRISGFGWGMGYLGGIVSLLAFFVLFINPDVGLFGVTSEDAMNIRAVMVACGLWTLIFTIPTFVSLRDKAPSKAVTDSQAGKEIAYRQFLRRYAQAQQGASWWRRCGYQIARRTTAIWIPYLLLGKSLKSLASVSRQTVYFLFASALFRDGLAGVFAFGGVIAGRTFGMSEAEIIYFGAAANIIAGLATIGIGALDDKIGPKRVIVYSLIMLLICGTGIFIFHDGGKTVFWALGLTMCAFVGPAQSASRSFLARVIPAGKAGEVFGLYATTGRVVSFLSPAMFGLMIVIGSKVVGGNAQYWGIIGIVIVLLAGMLVLLPVKEQHHHAR